MNNSNIVSRSPKCSSAWTHSMNKNEFQVPNCASLYLNVDVENQNCTRRQPSDQYYYICRLFPSYVLQNSCCALGDGLQWLFAVST